MVDIARPASVARRKKIRRTIFIVASLLVIGGVTYAVSKLKPAAPSVERATVWISTVQRGPMLRQVRGSGTLVPEEIRWIPATTSGRVEKILLRPGATVRPDSVILELSNPDLQQSVREAQLTYQSAQANHQNRKAELESQLLSQQSDVAGIKAAYNNAALKLQADEELFKDGLVSEIQLKQSRSANDELKNRLTIAERRLEMYKNGIPSQLAPQEAAVSQTRAAYELRNRQLDDLRVKAGMNGVLQLVPVERGAQVGPGTNLARVADPTNLKAELRIAETQTKDIRIGQYAEVDTRNGIVKGKVARIDPASSGGTVGVDVTLDGALPPGSRPDLSVDGTIELERLPDVVFMSAPAFGQENGTISLFKLTGDGEAIRTQVKIGKRSVNQVEVLEGLKPGDQVILSDMSDKESFDRVRIVG
ncbi:MAG: RND transporter [Acidobacteria bacterium RIFCSPLOWO2_02_FULL_67_36]|nr:MAG: RND transporter [Acidobacteria bacterium RIFCSPLOWO2_02_FULL_67_36]OFW19281.1 MAG: RND transporter [Acidobacteria bacterium RIFCSPLOWO2_12_FULL_66_21]